MHLQTASAPLPRHARPGFRRGARGMWFSAIAMLGLLLFMPAHAAVEIEGVADARVEVRGQGDSERERGFRRGLEQVVVRMTGNSRAPANPDLESLFARPGHYVQTFRYRRLDDDEMDADAEDPPTHQLRIAFNGARIEDALREAEVPVWSLRRPELLLWVGVDEGRERYIVGEQDGADARRALRERARMRGMPLMLPLLDVEDRDRVDFIDIRAPFVEAIERAAERYRADMILVGHVNRRTDEVWAAEWTLLADGREATWNTRAEAFDAVLGAGIDGATDRLSALLAPRQGETEQVLVTVEAIRSHADYARVADYLSGLARVRRAEVVQVAADTARFRVDLQGHAADFQRTVSIDTLLDPVPSPAVGAGLIEGDEPDAVDETDALDALVDELLGAPDSAHPGNGRSMDPSVAGETGDEDRVIELFYRLSG